MSDRFSLNFQIKNENKSSLTTGELDYLENVISKNYSLVPSKGYLTVNSSVNNEPSFKGQLSKYFPAGSNFNEIDFNELKTSELIVSDNSFYNIVLDEFYHNDSNMTDLNSSSDVLNGSPLSISLDEVNYYSNSVDVFDQKEDIQQLSTVSKRQQPVKIKPLKEKKIICMKDCLHVWEFLRDLLRDNRYNNYIIKWLDQKRGIFKILDPNSVSLLWGKKKLKKSDMKYPNMARGIRYSREEGGYFDSVSKSFGYGKKLVYKFSKKTLDHCEWLRSLITEY